MQSLLARMWIPGFYVFTNKKKLGGKNDYASCKYKQTTIAVVNHTRNILTALFRVCGLV